VRVVAQDELGNPILGATVELRLPGADGKLMGAMDLILSLRDGVRKGPGADGDKAEADGDVEFDVPGLGRKLKSGTAIMLTVNAASSGLAPWSTTTEYIDDKPLEVTSANKYVLKITVSDENEKKLEGLTVSAAGGEAVDGGTNDADGKADGVIYFSAPAPKAGEYNIQVKNSNGAVLFERAVTIDPVAQTDAQAIVKSP
jgi:hypothetical protein